jgi:phosphatidylserine/phosphatidylglycerophosphate/cardiolipin synthase-like enzyme
VVLDDAVTPYAPERQNITCRWFVDGKDTFLATYKAIKAATSSVFITDWWMVGEIYLKRNPIKVKPHHRLDMLLKRKAEEGLFARRLPRHHQGLSRS